MNYTQRILKVLNEPIKEGKMKWTFYKHRRVVCGWEIGFHVPLGSSYEKAVEAIPALVATCGHDVELDEYKGLVVVRIIEQDFVKELKFNPEHLKKDLLLIGYNRMLEPVYHPLNVHMLVGGASRSGKTDGLRWFVYQFLQQDSEVWICDLKGYSFFPFEGLVRIAKDLKSSEKMLAEAIKELNRRKEIIDLHRSRDIIKTFKPIVIIIDEAASLSPSQHSGNNKIIAKSCDDYISLLGQQSREPKIFCIYTTQRPEMNIINRQFKANVEASIAFRTKDHFNSTIILGRQGAEKISPTTPGRCIYGYDQDYLLQVPFIGGDREWNRLLTPFKTEVIQDGSSTRTDEKRNTVDGTFSHADSKNRTTGETVSKWISIEASERTTERTRGTETGGVRVVQKGEGVETHKKRIIIDAEYTDEI